MLHSSKQLQQGWRGNSSARDIQYLLYTLLQKTREKERMEERDYFMVETGCQNWIHGGISSLN